MTPALIAIALVIIASVFWSFRIRKDKNGVAYRLPPGPKGWPIVGNTFDIPSEKLDPVLARLSQKFTLRLGGSTWVFVNSHRVMRELLEKRGNIYCSKPHTPYLSETLSGGLRMALMEYGPKWRRLRKAMGMFTSMTEVRKFFPAMDLESTVMMYEYLTEPESYYQHNSRFSNSVVMSVCFRRRTEKGDKLVTMILTQFTPVLEAMRPGSNLVDVLPILENLPKRLQWWRKKGQREFNATLKTYRIPWCDLYSKQTNTRDKLVAEVENGEAPDCFAVHVYSHREEYGLSENEAMFAVLNTIEGGSDTTRATLNVFVAAMATDPEFLVRVRKELDAVCGDAERLPTFDDQEHLPLVTACVKEVMRWRPLNSAGVVRVLIQDDQFEDYYFPKGTRFTWSRRFLASDPGTYPDDPIRFYPERFLNVDLEKPLAGHWSFGTGRRVCAGYVLAMKNLWIAMAKMMYCFDVEYSEDAKANGFDPFKTEFMFLHPDTAPFHARITPRTPKHVKLIEESYSTLKLN